MADARPLEGLRILVSRARNQAGELADRLTDLGAVPIVLPSIEILPPSDAEPLERALSRLSEFDWVLFTSVNGVRSTLERVQDKEMLASRKLGAVGPATAKELALRLRPPDLIPEQYVAESFLPALGDVSGQRFLLSRGDLARKDIVRDLRERGAEVVDVEAYRTVAAPWPEEVPTPDILTFTSSSGVHATHERLAERGFIGWFESKPIVSIGPITSQAVRDLGYPVAATAAEHTIPGLVQTLAAYVAESRTAAEKRSR